MKLKLKLLFSMFCLILFSGVLQAQTAEKILKKHIKATGSKKYKKVETITMNGTLPTPQGEFPITFYKKKPNMTKIQLDIQGMQMIPSAYDGVTAWMVNPFAGASTPQKLPEEQARITANQAQIEPLYINYAKKGYSITFDGTEDVKGKSSYKLKIEKPGGDASDPAYHYFDTETYMLVKVNAKGIDGNRTDTFFGNYKKTDIGIMMPYSLEISSQMGMQPIEFTEIITNEPMEDEVFAFPGG